MLILEENFKRHLEAFACEHFIIYIYYEVYIYIYTKYIYISAVKRLIAINHIQNKCFCLHNI